MYLARDVLILAGLMALAAAVVASLFPAREGVSDVPACTDCLLKLRGGYAVVQEGDSAVLYLGTREVARLGWAYYGGRPLSVGDRVVCDPMYLYLAAGVAYVSCGEEVVIGRRLW